MNALPPGLMVNLVLTRSPSKRQQTLRIPFLVGLFMVLPFNNPHIAKAMQAPAHDHVFLNVAGQQEKVTLADGEKIRQTLLDYLEASGEDADEATVAQLAKSEPRIDPDGTLRIGAWLLETRLDRMALTRRNQSGSFFLIDVAYLLRAPDERWEVTDFVLERIPLRK